MCIQQTWIKISSSFSVTCTISSSGNNVSQCTINKRAWVTQERLLAPRILHFGRSQLLWECLEYDASESYPHGLPAFSQTQILTNFKALDPDKYVKKMARQGRDIVPSTSSYHLWNRIVTAYSET
ncbi:hypothetical protein EJ02DRAFT_469220 [Clathrospora elynae]|uniref:Uncharacterized protein n=1 Tax=Clathrospora elynae TaxID=706981 RepID=A0A6A5SHQ8_9PLEO|nr:hypothetical protein EJ02DRAFT_469220 [Clathrospora elynae]